MLEGCLRSIKNKQKINLTLIASGSEVNLAIETCHKLAKQKIYSKVISMPCQEILIPRGIFTKIKY